MINLESVKVTPRDQQVLNLLVQGCSNKEIAGQLNISPRTVKQHLRTLFLRAGIREGRKRVKLAMFMLMPAAMVSEPPARARVPAPWRAPPRLEPDPVRVRVSPPATMRSEPESWMKAPA